ncbi:unnamed protein product [Rotaria sp. Silwood2]|nr:unnamed protein product [Rotaria sp. Silwood2]CAF4532174.1 unnamed protein product [Rotaria sp. Silwood2]CAF4737248.1 unnamed protein product [Rotaria sp. Silwood2]
MIEILVLLENESHQVVHTVQHSSINVVITGKNACIISQATYTPIAAAGTLAQIEHLTRLLGAQLTAVGYGKGYELMRSEQYVKPPIDDDIEAGKPI